METCKRCGVKLKTINYRHADFCNRMPLPVDLAVEYQDGGYTYTDLALQYDCSINSLRQRIQYGFDLLEKDPAARPCPAETAGPNGQEVEYLPVQRCACEIILRTPAQQQRGTCDFCAGKTFDYMKFRQEETAVARCIPVDVSLSF
ncbi:MAG: hypothetical protein KDK05_12745 [Candidatus Competibacteraceae bacterium]|nr:hypothetical protein [Candidatus Competibacteraceae bacterium]